MTDATVSELLATPPVSSAGPTIDLDRGSVPRPGAPPLPTCVENAVAS
jgi:hypothetical protein